MAAPLTKEEFYERHSAFFQQIGFDVQFAGCMYYLISLGDSDTLSYETLDDFVIDRIENGTVIKEFYQVKYSSQAGANMTDSDSDFWKSVDNWLTPYWLCSDEEKKSYFTGSRFFILTNKRPKNFLGNLCRQLQNGTIELGDIRDWLSKVAVDASYKSTVDKLLALEDLPLRQFLIKVNIAHFENFITRMYEHFVKTFFNAARSDQIVKQLMGDLYQYKQTCGGDFSFTGNSFRQRFKHILDQTQLNDDTLTLEGYDQEEIHIPGDFSNMMMVKQLADIDAIDTPPSTEDDFLMEHLTRFFHFQNAFQDFEKTQLLTAERERRIDKAAEGVWLNHFRTHQDNIIQKDRKGLPLDEEEQKKAGRDTFNATMGETLTVNRLVIDQDFSKGWFLSMSNEERPRVAWHYRYYKTFKKDKKR